MSLGYSLSPRRAHVVRLAAVLFLVVGAGAFASIAIGFALPGGLAAFECEARGCVDRTDLVALAPDDQQAALRVSPAAREDFARYLARPAVRAGLAGAKAIENVPFAMLMFAVGMALRRLGARAGHDLARALPWLRRGAVAALAMALAHPVSEFVRASLLSGGTPDGPHWVVPLDAGRLATDLLLAAAALAVSWALDVGSRAARDMGEFV